MLPFVIPKFHTLIQYKNLNFQIVRNIVHFGAQYCWTIGVIFLPLAEVFALEFTMPLWVALLAYFILGEKISRQRLIAVIGGFIGILIVLRPGVAVIDPITFVVLVAAIGYAMSVILVKRLTSEVSSIEIVFWMVIIQLPLGLVPSLFTWSAPTLGDTPWIFLVGLSGLSAHYTMAQALKILDASVVIPIDFLRVPLIAIVGYYLYEEGLDIWVFIGAFLIFASNYYAIRKEFSARKVH